jgi:LacI family transcriptional regulator
MDPSGSQIVNLRTVALKAGVSRSTASLALRGDPRLRPETIQKVRQVAEALGYFANPYVSAFQTYVRSKAATRIRATLAILDVISDRNRPEHVSVRRIFQGVKQRATEQGFSTERFVLNQSEISARRLDQILHTRRIEGVLIAPSPQSEYRITGLDWSRYACATIGYSLLAPYVHRASNHHVHSLRTVFTKLREKGYRRIGVSLDDVTEHRVDGLFSAALLYEQSQLPAAQRVPMAKPDGNPKAFVRWLKKYRPDAVIADRPRELEWMRDAGYKIPSDCGFAVLDWSDSFDCAGYDQMHDAVGAAAVDLIVVQLMRNSRGIPEAPRVLLLEGCWRDGLTLASQI